MLSLLLALSAYAELPLPPFPDCGPEAQEACPAELPGQWELISWIPDETRDSIREAELELGSGIGLDRAIRHTAGRWDVVIAILDSGANWGDTRLGDTTWLNPAELPLSRRADGTEVEDLDGNGLLSLADWAEDPRVDVAAGADRADDRLDPSDLIHTFSDGVDDDHNGYPDDIAGWDFFHWDNDPFAVLQAGYSTHGTDVARDAGLDLSGDEVRALLTTTAADVWLSDEELDQAVGWASAHHDAQNTGNAHTPLPAQAGPPDEEAPGGCCSHHQGGATAWLALGLVPLVARRRKRRS